MRKCPTIPALAFMILAATAAPAADSAPLLTNTEWLNDWQVTRQFTIAVAEKMPEESYSFKPSPEEMNFAQLMMHIGASSVFRFEQLTGTKSGITANVLKASPKAGVIKYLNECFDYVLRALPTVTPEQLTRMYKVDWVGRPEVNGRQMMLGMFVHTAHHRGQAEVYLRLKGVQPPAYTF
ncbi:MAG: DinB family protein [Bryobacteraceae bacterium]